MKLKKLMYANLTAEFFNLHFRIFPSCLSVSPPQSEVREMGITKKIISSLLIDVFALF